MAIIDGTYINSCLIVLSNVWNAAVLLLFAKVKLLSTLDGDEEL